MENSKKSTTSVDQTVAQFIDAGIGLAMLPFSLVQQTFESTKENTSAKFDELQARGEKVESELRDKFDPAKQRVNLSNICNQVSLMLSPKASREAKIDTLSKKVDTLVELVATLAAKKAAEKAEKPKATRATTKKTAAAKEETATKAAPKTTRRRATTASKSTAAKTTTTRKRTTTKRATKATDAGDSKE